MNKFETVVEEIGHVIISPISFLIKTEKVIATAIKDQPALKATLTVMVQKSEALIADAAKLAGEKGLNLADDAATLADVEAYFAWVKSTLIPVIESIYTEIKTDIA